MTTVEFPKSICEGSFGPHVAVAQAFLCGTGTVWKEDGFVLDGVYGPVMGDVVARFQAENRLAVTRNWDQATQKRAREDFQFDYQGTCEKISDHSTFVQEDGTSVIWLSPVG